MRFTFLGTSASEGYPNAFCGCENCEKARQAGGPSLRKRCAALIDGELLIDLGPDLMAASMQHGITNTPIILTLAILARVAPRVAWWVRRGCNIMRHKMLSNVRRVSCAGKTRRWVC